MVAEQLITEHLDVWTNAIKPKAQVGRGRGKSSGSGKFDLYGINKLRDLILDLAVRGLLVRQDPDDAPASNLIEEIKKEREELYQSREIGKPKIFGEISGDEKPFDLPRSWSWVRIADLGHDWGQKTPEKEFIYIDVGAIDNTKGIVVNPNMLSPDEAPSRARKIVKKGTVIYSTVRPYLKNICVIDEDYTPEPIASTAFAILHPFQNMPGELFALYFRSPVFVRYVESVQTGIAYPAINDKQFFSGIFPLPPLQEQKRIVEKVEELMSLCDQLEQQTDASLSAHQTLVETLLNALTNAADNNTFQQAWQRIAQHFDTLFTTENSIDQLKQTILQLAVMGKLVPQNPNDEPANELLKKIATEKTRLIKDGKIKKQKPLPDISEREKLVVLPKGWVFTRTDDICYGITSGSTPPKSDFVDTDGIPYLKVYNIREQEIDFDYNPQFVSIECHEKKLKRSVLKPGDVVMNIVGPPLGKTAIIPGEYQEWNCNQAITFFRPIELSINKYIHLYLKAGMFLKSIELIGTAGQDNISVTKSRSIVLPLPPLEEQKRIVRKVDELISICDQLKTQLSIAKTTQLYLADAITNEAVA